MTTSKIIPPKLRQHIHHVFFAHHEDEEDLIGPIVKFLREKYGFTCNRTGECLPGSKIIEFQHQSIQQAKKIVLCLSPAFVGDPLCWNQTQYALCMKKIKSLRVVQARDCKVPKELKKLITEIHLGSLYKDSQVNPATLGKLLQFMMSKGVGSCLRRRNRRAVRYVVKRTTCIWNGLMKKRGRGGASHSSKLSALRVSCPLTPCSYGGVVSGMVKIENVSDHVVISCPNPHCGVYGPRGNVFAHIKGCSRTMESQRLTSKSSRGEREGMMERLKSARSFLKEHIYGKDGRSENESKRVASPRGGVRKRQDSNGHQSTREMSRATSAGGRRRETQKHTNLSTCWLRRLFSTSTLNEKELSFKINRRCSEFLPVVCTNPECKEVVLPKLLVDHLSVCKFSTSSCPYKCAGCPNDLLFRWELAGHMARCEWAPYHCVCGQTILRKDKKRHQTLCPDRLTKCPACCATVERDELRHHKRYECQNLPVLCDHCGAHVLAKDHQDHIQTQHVITNDKKSTSSSEDKHTDAKLAKGERQQHGGSRKPEVPVHGTKQTNNTMDGGFYVSWSELEESLQLQSHEQSTTPKNKKQRRETMSRRWSCSRSSRSNISNFISHMATSVRWKNHTSAITLDINTFEQDVCEANSGEEDTVFPNEPRTDTAHRRRPTTVRPRSTGSLAIKLPVFNETQPGSREYRETAPVKQPSSYLEARRGVFQKTSSAELGSSETLSVKLESTEKPPSKQGPSERPSGTQRPTAIPLGNKVSTATPLGTHASTATPLGNQVSIKTPQGTQVSTATPLGNHVFTATPLGNQVSIKTPQGTHVSTATPLGNHVSTKTTLGTHVSIATPLRSHISTATPLGNHVFSATPLGNHVSTATPLGNLASTQTDRRSVEPGSTEMLIVKQRSTDTSLVKKRSTATTCRAPLVAVSERGSLEIHPPTPFSREESDDTPLTSKQRPDTWPIAPQKPPPSCRGSNGTLSHLTGGPLAASGVKGTAGSFSFVTEHEATGLSSSMLESNPNLASTKGPPTRIVESALEGSRDTNNSSRNQGKAAKSRWATIRAYFFNRPKMQTELCPLNLEDVVDQLYVKALISMKDKKDIIDYAKGLAEYRHSPNNAIYRAIETLAGGLFRIVLESCTVFKAGNVATEWDAISRICEKHMEQSKRLRSKKTISLQPHRISPPPYNIAMVLFSRPL